MNNRKETVWALILSLLATALIALAFSHTWFKESTVYYHIDDYSFLTANPSDTSYDEQQLADLRETITASGYTVSGRNDFTIIADNPMISFQIPGTKLNKVRMEFLEPLAQDMKVKITTVNEQEETKIIEDVIHSSANEFEMGWESDQLTALHITIGNAPDTSFQLANLEIMNENVKYWSFMSMVKLEGIFIVGYYFLRKMLMILFKTNSKV